MVPFSPVVKMASSEHSTMAASRARLSSAFLRSVTSQTMARAPTNSPRGPSSGLVAGRIQTTDPSLRRKRKSLSPPLRSRRMKVRAARSRASLSMKSYSFLPIISSAR